MPRTKTNKSQMVRDMLTENPKVLVKDVVQAMSAKGLKVSSNLVYLQRAKLRAKKRRMGRSHANGMVYSSSADPINVIMRAKALANDVGGLNKLKQLVEVLAE